MKNRFFLTLLAVGMLLPAAQAQYVYAIRYLGAAFSSSAVPYLVVLDLEDCNMCLIKPLNNRPEDMVVLPNGELLILINSDAGTAPSFYFETYNLPNLTPTNITAPITGFRANSMALHNGVIYLTINTDLYTYDPVSNQITLLGTLGPGIANSPTLFSFNGQLLVVDYTSVYSVNLANPANSSLLGSIGSGLLSVVDAVVMDGEVYVTSGCATCGITSSVFSIDMNNFTGTTACGSNFFVLPFISVTIDGSPPFGMVEAPDDHPYFPCACANTAGDLTTPSVVCGPPFQVTVYPGPMPSAGNGDVVRYLLVSDATNLPSSIIASSSSPIINVPPSAVQYGVTYYVLIAVGELLNGVIDFSDECTQVSASKPVVFQPKPTVTLQTANSEVCQSGECITVTATISGSGPFLLNYRLVSGSTVLSTQSVNSATSPFDFEICLPAGVPVGPLTITPISVSNSLCNCQ